MELWIGILINMLLALMGMIVMVAGVGSIILIVDKCGDSNYATAIRIDTTVGTKTLAIVYPKRWIRNTDF